MKWRIGDRFRCSLMNHWFIWEIVGYTDSNKYFKAKIISHWDNDFDPDNIKVYNVTSDIYLGNFGKSKNFNSLYEKLSQP